MFPVNHTNTHVLLIGVSEFPEDKEIEPIPNVTANLKLLSLALSEPALVGIPQANIITSCNEDRISIEKRVKYISEKADRNSTLVIYFAGHGMFSKSDTHFYFSTHNVTLKDLEIDGINIDLFKKNIDRSTAARKILILDCCFSGAFIGEMGDMSSKIQAEINDFTGSYVMTSSSKKEASKFPFETPEKPTHFTGKLLEIFNNGLDINKPVCSLRDAYREIWDDFKRKGYPLPQQSNLNRADEWGFFANKKNTLSAAEIPVADKLPVDPITSSDVEGDQVELIGEVPYAPGFNERFGLLGIMLMSIVLLIVVLYFAVKQLI